MINLYRRLQFTFFCHWVASLGVVITSASALLFIGLQFQEQNNPYASLVTTVALPATFILGLLLIPAGIYLRTRGGQDFRTIMDSPEWTDRSFARVGLIVLAATGVNLALMSVASYEAVEYMGSDAFCGTMCHAMEPQFTAYQASPHARIGCTSCHIGPGAQSFLTAKVEGAGRLLSMVTGYERPIRIGASNRQQVTATCLECHAGETDRSGPRMKVIRAFGDDEPSTPATTVLTFDVGAVIHPAHAQGRVQYVAADSDRAVIPWTAADGNAFVAGEETASADPQPMTCIDCHNRVGHEFLPLERAVDTAIADGRLARTLPFVRRNATQALENNGNFPAAANAIAALLERNVFTDHGVDWGTYRRLIGHEAGCFRCHDGQHRAAGGETLTAGCFGCHALVAIGVDQAPILDQLGISP